MSNTVVPKSLKLSARPTFRQLLGSDISTTVKLNFMAFAIAAALAATFVITIAGMGLADTIHASAIRNEQVFHELMEFKASALSTIMLDPASPDTKVVFDEAGRIIEKNSRLSLEAVPQGEMSLKLTAIVSAWGDYERESNKLITLSASDRNAAKEGIVPLYKGKFIPFRDNLESFITAWLVMVDDTEHDAARSMQIVKWSVSSLILLITAAIVVMMFFITRSINANVRDKEESFRKLRQSESLLDTAQQMAKVGGWEFDVERQTLFWTEEVYRIHDIARGDIPSGSTRLIDMSVECYAPESRPVILAAFQKCVAEGVPYDMEFPFTSVKGRRMWIRTSGIPIFDNDKVVKVVGDIMDITKLKRAEEELNRFFNLVPDMVCVASTDGYFLKINPMWEKVLGFTERELRAAPFLDFIHPDDREPTMKEVARQIGGEATIEFLNRYRCKDGSYKWLEWMAIPSPDKKRLFAAARDITERKMAQEELTRAKEIAEDATKVKDKFVSLVAHDLKTPLSSITAFLKLVRDDEAAPLDAGKKLILDKTIDSGKRLSQLIDDLLNLNRLKTGQLKLDKQFFDAKYLGAKMCADFAYTAESKGIALTSAIPDNSRIYGDRALLGEALQNLVTNAIKFCGKGDAITISLAAANKTAIVVKDTGPGMKPEALNKLFKFESKVTTVGSAGEIGTGFGLPLVKDIMLLHGGNLEVEGEEGKGCTFTLAIPYVRPSILIVDDDPAFRFGLMQFLRTVDADIIEAEDGAAAVDIIAKAKMPPSLIISDIEMPKMDGLKLLAYLQNRSETEFIPVIIVSGEHGMEIRDTVYGLGGKDFLTKQLDVNDFIPRVRRFIS